MPPGVLNFFIAAGVAIGLVMLGIVIGMSVSDGPGDRSQASETVAFERLADHIRNGSD